MTTVKECTDLPSIVKIGGYNVQVMRITSTEADARRIYGEFSPREMVIRMDEGATLEKAAGTLLHEILHAAWWNGRLKDDDKEERIIETLEHQFLAIWRDNRAVMDWIAGNIPS